MMKRCGWYSLGVGNESWPSANRLRKKSRGSRLTPKAYKAPNLLRIFILPNLTELAGYYSQQAWINISQGMFARLKVRVSGV